MAEDRFCFLVDWFDAQASLNRRYQLLFYPSDNSVEMYEVKTRRQFLKRCKQENVQLTDLYIGNTITILARTMKLIEYGDAYTTKALSNTQQKMVGILTVAHHPKLGQIVDAIYKGGLKISKMRRVKLNAQEVYFLLESQRHKPSFNILTNSLSEGPIVVFELMGANAQNVWLNTIGITDITSDLEQEALNKINTCLLHERSIGSNTAVYSNTTCCIIKPHIVSSGMAGAVIYEIQKAGFEVNAIQAVNFTKPNAEEFLEIYKGVLQEYPEMVEELISGTCVALEIKAPDSQRAFREFSGPHDPEIARTLRPQTLRALFGLDKIKNAVHCTDLPEDAILEVEYFFRILDQN